MPWQGKTLIGTTETRFEGEPNTVSPTEDEVRYLQSVYAYYFPKRAAEIIDAFAGVRVLAKAEGSFFDRPRDTVLHMNSPALLSLYGGKLTGYRATAEQVIAMLRPLLPRRVAKADTEKLVLSDTAVEYGKCS